jgi:hypothetical protein
MQLYLLAVPFRIQVVVRLGLAYGCRKQPGISKTGIRLSSVVS